MKILKTLLLGYLLCFGCGGDEPCQEMLNRVQFEARDTVCNRMAEAQTCCLCRCFRMGVEVDWVWYEKHNGECICLDGDYEDAICTNGCSEAECWKEFMKRTEYWCSLDYQE